MKPLAIITGASSGFGYDIALQLASISYDLVLLARRGDKLYELQQQLTQRYPDNIYEVCIADIRKRDELQTCGIMEIIQERGVDVLINNAGLASGLSQMKDGDEDDWDRMIDTNIKGVLYISRMVIPYMVSRGSGHIINMSSIAGKQVYDKGNVYCATKHGLDALTRSMRLELSEFGIKVTSISPGAAETEFSLVRFKGDKERASKVYEGFTALMADDISRAVLFVLGLPGHVNIDELTITPLSQGTASLIHRR
jgi:3-hydroxy acid dehydrogenase / malonic semialdehyde reductase